MPRNAAVNIENDFSRGLITEVSALAFPENACTEIWDCVITNQSKVKRRQGFEYEDNYTTKTIDRDDGVVRNYLWENVTGDGSLNLLVVQVGGTLYFYKASSSPISSTANTLTTNVTLSTFSPSGAETPDLTACQFTDGDSTLFVTHPDVEPFYCTYDATTEGITATQIDIKIRDREGLDDGLEINERPTSTKAGLSDEHEYNLYNQGWYYDESNIIDVWDSNRSDMPSNADVWWRYKDSNQTFNHNWIDRFDVGTSPAPKGHYILNAFDLQRDAASGVSGVADVTTLKRPNTAAFFVQRLFYAGVPDAGYQSKIYFSKVIEGVTDYGLCYQQNDPTSEFTPDLVASDGGVIDIQEAGLIIKMVPVQSQLLVFASNGVWAIAGSDGVGFTATDFSVTKISSVNAISESSFIDVDGLPCWWNNNGIFVVQPDDVSGSLGINDITIDTIKTFYDDIPPTSKQFCRGYYNSDSKIAQWLFRSTAADTSNEIVEYDRILNLNFRKGAFYPWTISSSDLKIHDLFVVRVEGGPIQTDQVIDAALDTVIDGSTNNVVVTSISELTLSPRFKYLVSSSDGGGSYDFSFVEENNPNYLDFDTFEVGGTDYSSYFVTGYKIHGETQKFFQPNYVFVFLDQETDASALLQAQYDWTNSSSANKFSSSQQVYNSNLTNRDINFRRLKVRGKGRALQLRMTSESGKPFTIVGWSIYETGNANL